MELRSLACRREVGIHYDIPLTREQRFSEPFIAPEVVVAMGIYVFQARDAINSKYSGRVKVDSQLDYNRGFGGLGRDQVRGYNFTVGFDRTNKDNVSLADLEEAVLEFLDMVPFKPTVGGAPIDLFQKIESYEPKELVA